MDILARIKHKPVGLFIRMVLALLLLQPAPAAIGLSDSQKKALQSGIYYFNTEASDICSVSGGDIPSTLPPTIPEPYSQLLTNAAAAFNTSSQLLAAIYLTENGNTWKPFDTNWASSPVGASGPFQFMPSTWAQYAVDGNNDGAKDINNIYDAAFSAANLLHSWNARPNSELGSLEQPLKTNTLLQIAASYNAGPGQVQIWGSSAPMSTLFRETQEYVSNVYSLISSGFTKSGKPGYPDPVPSVGPGNTTPALPTQALGGCSSGVVSGSIVQTAINLAWDTRGHGTNKEDARSSYQIAMPIYNGSRGNDAWSDCGIFVSTVMRASGADPDYPLRLSARQLEYARQNPTKYTVFEGIKSTDQLRAGDILVNTQHTYIYLGSQPTLDYNAVGASLGDHVPEASGAYFEQNGEPFSVVRLN